jgi:hypothetical protein
MPKPKGPRCGSTFIKLNIFWSKESKLLDAFYKMRGAKDIPKNPLGNAWRKDNNTDAFYIMANQRGVSISVCHTDVDGYVDCLNTPALC